jgi:Protein of unknown function (DUF1573)
MPRMRMVQYLVLLMAATLSPAGQMLAQPRLQLDGGEKFTFGSIYRGQVLERKVTVRNGGTDTLEISNVVASCGCTGAMVDVHRIAPGGTGTLAITFNSKNFSGEVHKTVTIHSNSAGNPSQVIEFTATVIDEITFSPLQFWFKDAEVGKKSRSVVKLKNLGKEPLTLKSVRLTLEVFVLHLPEEPLKPGAETELLLEFTPSKPYPFMAEGAFIATSNPHQPEIYIPIYGNAKEFKFE